MLFLCCSFLPLDTVGTSLVATGYASDLKFRPEILVSISYVFQATQLARINSINQTGWQSMKDRMEFTTFSVILAEQNETAIYGSVAPDLTSNPMPICYLSATYSREL